MAYPEGANAAGARLDIYKMGENNAISGGYGNQAIDLLPGSYAVVISGKRVEEVTIRSGHDTKLRVGVLRVTAGGGTRLDLLDAASKTVLTGGYGSQQFGLPVGKVDVRVAGQSETVTVKDRQITDF